MRRLTGIYKREPKADRPTHVYVEVEGGGREPMVLEGYEAFKIEPDWRKLPWESDYKEHSQ